MVLQHSVANRIVGHIQEAEPAEARQAPGRGKFGGYTRTIPAIVTVTVVLDGVIVGSSTTTMDSKLEFDIAILPQPASDTPHTISVNAVSTDAGIVASSGGGDGGVGGGDVGVGLGSGDLEVSPAVLSDVLFGEVYLCSGQSK